MKRREFITLLGGAAGWPLGAGAQQADRVKRISVLLPYAERDVEAQARLAAFRNRLQELGWLDGRNARIDLRWAEGDVEHLRAQAVELAETTPDVILAGNTLALIALQKATHVIPIVFVQVADPVAGGFVANLSRPGGNMTGFTPFEPAMTGKWLELLKEIAPGVSRVLALQNPDNVGWPAQLSAMEQLAPSFKTKLTPAPVRDGAEIEQALTAFAREQNGGLLVLPDNVTVINRQRIIALAYEHRLTAIYAFRFFATSGGLVSYGTDVLQQHRFAADYVDRILKGAKPGDLPVQAPTKFELVINLKTAGALGLTVPPMLLASADEVIE